MDASAVPSSAPLCPPRARIGLIIPSVNCMSEPQFNHFAPPGLGIHVARARITGAWRRPIAQMKEEIAAAAAMLADCGADLIVYHCTDSSMREGVAGEEKIVEIIQGETGIQTLATSALVIEALRALAIHSMVILSPYPNNDVIARYLRERGFAVLHDVALALTPQAFSTVTPARWLELARDNVRAEADGIFLSCTNTTQIEAIADIERSLGKSVVNSNQAVLWGCLKRLRRVLPQTAPDPRLGALVTRE
jgi:maleate cis-trans isomerase